MFTIVFYKALAMFLFTSNLWNRYLQYNVLQTCHKSDFWVVKQIITNVVFPFV